ncbi:hypothetical protein KIN20_020315 [Parelaphostrongylus tenuis]|uniref:Uncharacterized protein n=1 Tax=Parelaphostrongylus tenuis TaxID=148309 RepID=A0AAD5MM96_PARTN|nr:hypothetical protein KIN20_020315 [Parelaphostrongylus tenuis]
MPSDNNESQLKLEKNDAVVAVTNGRLTLWTITLPSGKDGGKVRYCFLLLTPRIISQRRLFTIYLYCHRVYAAVG